MGVLAALLAGVSSSWCSVTGWNAAPVAVAAVAAVVAVAAVAALAMEEVVWESPDGKLMRGWRVGVRVVVGVCAGVEAPAWLAARLCVPLAVIAGREGMMASFVG